MGGCGGNRVDLHCIFDGAKNEMERVALILLDKAAIPTHTQQRMRLPHGARTYCCTSAGLLDKARRVSCRRQPTERPHDR